VTVDDARPREHVDVGVVTYNTRDVSVRALRHLLDTDQGCDVRLLVRDNGSTDGTADAIATDVPEAELERGTNVGFGSGMNHLLARSTTPYFLCLNPDAWPEPGAIGTLLAAAHEHPEAAAIAPRLERPDGTLEHSTLPFPSARVAAILATGAHRFLPAARLDELLLEGSWHHDRARDVDWAVGAALLMRRTALDEIGGFDERFFMYAEDLEWCWRAHQHGWTIRFEPTALVRHVGNVSGAKTYGASRTAVYMRNTYRFYRREHGVPAMLLFRALNVTGSGRRWLTHRVRGRRGAATFWSTQLRAHLVSSRGVDGPPAEQREPDGAVPSDGDHDAG
jgi:GT2 family glycosyltransferase